MRMGDFVALSLCVVELCAAVGAIALAYYVYWLAKNMKKDYYLDLLDYGRYLKKVEATKDVKGNADVD